MVYQIYPLSWADSNRDGFGDLPGITAHLDHLAGRPDSLGVDAIWLSPIYRSPMVDFGYDISDHCSVDPRFGTLADADLLFGEAHGRGLRVLLDYVPNHTSDQHPWFAQSRSSRRNRYRDWYVWADPGPDGGPPNNWLSAFERTGPAWTYDQATGQWYLHSFTSAQPDLNWRNPDARAAMHDVLRFWLRRGVDGFRIDVPHRLGKHPELADNPADVAALRRCAQLDGRRHNSMDHPDGHDMMRGIRAVVDEFPGRVLVGEVGVHHPQRRLAYHGSDGDELHLIFDFGFWRNPWRADAFRAAGARLARWPDAHRWPTHALSNHDIRRHATRFARAAEDGPDTLARVRVAAILLLTLPGTTFLYYGEEIGMTDLAVPAAHVHDPDGRDPCRSPMRWRSGPGAGFTEGQPWLPTGSEGPTVAGQDRDPGSVLNLYRRLVRLRAGDERLRLGGYRLVDSDPDVYAFLRLASVGAAARQGAAVTGRAGDPAGRLLVLANFADQPRQTGLDRDAESLPDQGVLLAGSGQRPAGVRIRLTDLVLCADEAMVIEI